MSARLAFLAVLLVAAPLAAQELDPDNADCQDTRLLSRMPGCRLAECSASDFDEAQLRIGPYDEAKGDWPVQAIQGRLEELVYECPARLSHLQIHRNAETALTRAGYAVVHAERSKDSPWLTVRKDDLWLSLVVESWGHPAYRLQIVRAGEMAQVMTASADELARTVVDSGRVAVYGIEFDIGKATLRPEAEPVLAEVLKLLENHPDWRMRVEGHTDATGTRAGNQALSDGRAKAVVQWLVAKGIEGKRLTARGLGDTKPVADNATDAGRASNRRVELVRF